MNIRGKILAAMAISVFFSITGVLITAYIEMNNVFVNNFTTNSRAQLDRMNSFVDNFFGNAIAITEFISDMPYVQEGILDLSNVNKPYDFETIGEQLPGVERQIYNRLKLFSDKFPSFLLTYVANNSDGMTQAPNDGLPANFRPSQRPWYLDAVRANKPIITAAYASATGDGIAVTTVANPIKHDGRTVGVAAIDISLETLSREVGNVHVGNTGYVLLFDSEKNVVSDPKNSGSNIPEAQRWLGKNISDLPSGVSSVINSLYDMHEGYKEIKLNGVDWLASVETTEQGWVLMMLQTREEVFAGAWTVTQHIATVGVVVGILLLIMASFVAKSIARPIGDLTAASSAVAEGDLNAIPENDMLYTGETRVLHQSLKSMVKKLAELIESSNQKMKEAEEAVVVSNNALAEADKAKREGELARRQGILETAEQIGYIVTDLTQAMQVLSKETETTTTHAEHQKARVESTATAITEMNTAVADVASSTSRTALLAEDARNETSKGNSLVSGLIENMHEIERKSRAMQDSLANLRDQANDINSIMSMITDIADQTNLLALNAAIEAARAGESGRGFAVVADEVRKLAEKTMQATKQVEVSVSTIQNGSEMNMKAIDETVNFVTNSANVATNAGNALSGIEDMVKKTADEVRSIATASEEQSATLEAINNSTNEIHDIALKVNDSTESSTMAVKQLGALTNNLEEIVSNLQRDNA